MTDNGLIDGWGLPQWVVATLCLLNFFLYMTDGAWWKPIKSWDEYRGLRLAELFFDLLLLYAGGFWK